MVGREEEGIGAATHLHNYYGRHIILGNTFLLGTIGI